MTLDFEATAHLGAFSYEAAFSARDEILVLFGHSGAGKSVSLQLIAGLLEPSGGRIIIDGRTVFDRSRRINVRPQDRRVGYVVQDLALFQHMSVRENIRFGLPRDADPARVDEVLRMLSLDGLGNRRPRTLSGGQQQRVALARALARDSRLLLLDEPFSALDESLRSALRRELLRLRKDLGLTIVFVTHDLREAHLLADQLAVFDQGRVLQSGPRETVFRRPRTRRVAELTGVANVFEGQIISQDKRSTLVGAGGIALRCDRYPHDLEFAPGAPVDVAIRAERVNLRRHGAEADASNLFEATVVEEFAYGASHTLHLRPIAAGPSFEVEIAARPYDILGVAAQRDWLVELPPADLHVMERVD